MKLKIGRFIGWLIGCAIWYFIITGNYVGRDLILAVGFCSSTILINKYFEGSCVEHKKNDTEI